MPLHPAPLDRGKLAQCAVVGLNRITVHTPEGTLTPERGFCVTVWLHELVVSFRPSFCCIFFLFSDMPFIRTRLASKVEAVTSKPVCSKNIVKDCFALQENATSQDNAKAWFAGLSGKADECYSRSVLKRAFNVAS